MRQLNLPIPGPELTKKLQKAQELRDKHVSDFEKDPDKKISTTDHYREFKILLMKNQFDKCAYCECKIGNQPGDVEHFRPKGRVTEIDGSVVEVRMGEGPSKKHPGYFWLAYDLTNLFMSCADCNRARFHEDSVSNKPIKLGKADVFPVQGKRAFKPTDQLTREKPGLVDPKDNPSKHLELNPTSGMFKALSKEGENTIELFGLNKRENLREERRMAYSALKNVIHYYSGAKNSEDKLDAKVYEKLIYEVVNEKSPHYTAAKKGWEESKRKYPESVVDAIINDIVKKFHKR